MKKPKKSQPGDVVRTMREGETIVVDDTLITAESAKHRRVQLRIQPRDPRSPPMVYPLD